MLKRKKDQKENEEKNVNEAEEAVEEMAEEGKKKKPFALFKKKDKKPKNGSFVRFEDLQKEFQDKDIDDIDLDKVVSMYMPHRRARLFGRALLRLDRLYLWLLGLLFAVAFLFILSFMQEKMGNFTINLNRLELYRKGVAIADTNNFEDPTARLIASTVMDATNISINDLPDNLDDIDGDHNGYNYVAYTYYVRNAGKEDVAYIARINLDQASKGAEDAVRVVVYHNGERMIYAKQGADGKPEPGTTSFIDNKTVCYYYEDSFLVGNVDKYTIVIFMEGDDPECVDRIVGGSVQFSMDIDARGDDDTTLLMKFIRDIWDTITDNTGIDVAGTEAPGYYLNENLTWENRRNQGEEYERQLAEKKEAELQKENSRYERGGKE